MINKLRIFIHNGKNKKSLDEDFFILCVLRYFNLDSLYIFAFYIFLHI